MEKDPLAAWETHVLEVPFRVVSLEKPVHHRLLGLRVDDHAPGDSRRIDGGASVALTTPTFSPPVSRPITRLAWYCLEVIRS